MRATTTERRWSRMVLPLAALIVALPALAAGVSLETGSVETTGMEPILTKTGTLKITSRLEGPMENVVATLQESPSSRYTIVAGSVDLPTVQPGETVESTDTFTVTVDLSIEASLNIPMAWLVDFDLDGDHRQIKVPVILQVPETEE